MSTAAAAIEVRGLSKRFGETLAVSDLSFTVTHGKIVGFLGPNGAGKTTTLRASLGVVNPTSGTALIEGRPYRELENPSRVVGSVLDGGMLHPVVVAETICGCSPPQLAFRRRVATRC